MEFLPITTTESPFKPLRMPLIWLEPTLSEVTTRTWLYSLRSFHIFASNAAFDTFPAIAVATVLRPPSRNFHSRLHKKEDLHHTVPTSSIGRLSCFAKTNNTFIFGPKIIHNGLHLKSGSNASPVGQAQNSYLSWQCGTQFVEMSMVASRLSYWDLWKETFTATLPWRRPPTGTAPRSSGRCRRLSRRRSEEARRRRRINQKMLRRPLVGPIPDPNSTGRPPGLGWVSTKPHRKSQGSLNVSNTFFFFFFFLVYFVW